MASNFEGVEGILEIIHNLDSVKKSLKPLLLCSISSNLCVYIYTLIYHLSQTIEYMAVWQETMKFRDYF